MGVRARRLTEDMVHGEFARKRERTAYGSQSQAQGQGGIQAKNPRLQSPPSLRHIHDASTQAQMVDRRGRHGRARQSHEQKHTTTGTVGRIQDGDTEGLAVCASSQLMLDATVEHVTRTVVERTSGVSPAARRCAVRAPRRGGLFCRVPSSSSSSRVQR